MALSPPLRNVGRVLCASTLTLTLLEMRWLVAHHQFFFPTHRMFLRQSFHPNSPNPVFTVILPSDKVLSLLTGRRVSNLPRFYYRSKCSSYLNWTHKTGRHMPFLLFQRFLLRTEWNKHSLKELEQQQNLLTTLNSGKLTYP